MTGCGALVRHVECVGTVAPKRKFGGSIIEPWQLDASSTRVARVAHATNLHTEALRRVELFAAEILDTDVVQTTVPR